ncbi:hypothetical protein KEG38_02050 [Polyangium jinanense]|uniref:hypothetical protein n=1 Tax=Polyangium jinanense TaxID=2829994 RepID=UPI00234150DB|nr:hypothetical protein [Polyangium jinanense]MDC3952604.1 hypothetical protein [Polyangium jinanense]
MTGDRVTAVKPKGPRLDDAGVQHCMTEALRRMADAGFSPDSDATLLTSRGYLFTEVIAPIQSEHLELAPPDFKPMQVVERPRLKLTKEDRDELSASLNRLYERIEAMAGFMRENCDAVEAATYRGRIHEVLVHVSEAMACVLAAHVEGEPVYDDTEVHRRLVEAANRERAEYPTWKAIDGK